MPTPSLSIIIPCYNYGRFLGESIESILAQDFEDYEIIIVDDASTDNTPDIIQEYVSRYPQISFYKHQRNLGVFEANITGINAAKGSYIHCFSSDDLYLPGFLSSSMKFLQSTPEVPFICTDIAYFQDGETLFSKEIRHLNTQTPVFFDKNEVVSLFQTTSFWIPGVTCIIKKEVLKKYGWLDPLLENISDWFFFHQIALLEGAGYIPKMGIAMRQHPATYTSRVKKDKKRTRATYWYLLNLLSKKENRALRTLFKKSTLLTFIFNSMFWKLAIRPKYWDFFPYISKKTPLSSRLIRSLKKRFL